MIINKMKCIDPILVTAIGVGILFRLLLWKTTRFMIGFDEANYVRLAGSAVQNGLFSVAHPYWSPFYPFIIYCFSIFTENLETAGRWVNILAGVGIMPLIYMWSRRLFGSGVARLTAFMLALYPPLAFDSTAVMPELIYSLAGLSGMMLGWLALTKQRWSYGLFAGICWGAAYLSKPEGIGYILVFCIFTLGWWIVKRRKISFSKMGLITLITVVGFLGIASPYLIYLRQSTGQWTISTKGMLNQQMQAAVLFNDGPVKDPFFHVTSDNQHLPYDMGLHFGNFHELKSLSESKDRIVKLSVNKYIFKYTRNFYQLIKEALPQLFGIVLFTFFVLGFFSSRYPSHKLFLIYIGLYFGFFWFGMVPLFHVNIRYLAPLFPLLFIWIAAGVFVFFRWLSDLIFLTRRLLKSMVVLIISILLIVGVFLPELGVALNQGKPSVEMWAQPLELKAASLWLKSRSEKPPKLMTLNKAIDFYAGQYCMTEGASFSYDSIEKNVAYARHRGCEYLVFTSRYLSWFENLKPLIEDSDLPGLKRIYDVTNEQGIRAVIYQLADVE